MNMARKWLLALLALILVTPAMAQLVVRPIQRPVPVQPMPAPDTTVQQDSDAASKIMTIEEAQARISQLSREKRELSAKLTETLATLEQMTTRGGSLVKAYCEGSTMSRNTAGASQDCGSYQCGEVDGLCKTSCTNSATDCSSGRSCSKGRCLTLAEAQNEG